MLVEKEKMFNPEDVIEQFEALTMDAGRVQEETLRRILQDNSDTEYLRKFGLSGRTDPESFKACIPLVAHKDLEPYIQRIADGDGSPILTGKPITTISLSSGTTQGKPKFVPFNDELMDTTMQIFKTSFAFRNRDFPIGKGKALQFIYSSKQFKTKGGLAAGTATTNVYRNQLFSKTMKAMNTPCCSPDEVIFGPDFHQSLYCHLLCGLIFCKEVQVVSSTFAHSIIHAFRTFEQVWEELCADIREGVLSSRITVPSIRAAMSRLLKPDPELADTIYYKCKGLSNWYGLIPELFPNTRYIYGIMTGSMEPYLKKLRHYAGDLPLLSADYGSSEGWIAANVNPKLPPESVTFAVLPNIGYFEFIPLKDNVDGLELEPSPVGLTEVKVGEEYEIIVTSFAGLYRYRLGDVVKVKGFHNSTPELQFICRRNLLLSINIDKNTEKDLQLSVEAASKILADSKLEVLDFTSHVNTSTDPGNYVIFWEVSGEASDEVLKECCNCLDRSFLDAGYMSSRKVNSIGPLELRVVRRGTFHKILDHFVGLGAAVSQFKTPRCVGANNTAVLAILCNNVVKTYFSTAYI
ncbi:jasmonoyl--L-amino acid synthetase JAR4 [Ipomoea triloba]|uniref:jasmonoyl--L-amino acid synthetase JAR4 n=1 Tax=Ipomoea triloba TaxID=35885 RepID=UPI00125CFCEA|nr:jasmonoyl--L-amino acid synthetase JAR4 [Ipomoea triloba]XP_031127273.1 jasmonoyl--L-amino acid synthetase JAR4 [Ipomoea triloba]GLL25638.1 jasmonic acid-amido synthetase JAR1 [Ipomoea trifida]GMC80439.1 jasmonic acid-amido synthetase JAR1-like [Ipomoea batatas]GMC84897.1 jasmonic acid-amido synthetase JAR1-like [Ipomoea batatas]GMC90976.1 jasmonic acid-amido synthetase JAR1-like [Ipomoea batatas]GME08190.1 jasmonic acid-amido synthetase JAR1-like [Ipomoea batatas]